MSITGKSQVFGILGDPVGHSLSPLMQNQAFDELGIDAVYVPFHVLPENLPLALAGLRALQVSGVNVTIPHKEAVLPLLDDVDANARLIGAVNTIANRQGLLHGYNTDGLGFLRSAEQELDFQPAQSRVVMLGAGGACRAAVVALAAAGALQISIGNRSLGRAEQLVKDLAGQLSGTQIQAFRYQDQAFQDTLQRADLVVNTTSVGLRGEPIDLFQLENINRSALFYDMVYSKADTPLLKSARLQGLRAVDGLGMLAAQGEEAFFLWTGRRPAPGMMRACLMKYRAND